MTMLTPSLQSLTLGLNRVLKRFPFAAGYSLLGTIAALIATTETIGLAQSFWIRILLCCELGLVFSIALRLVLEKWQIPGRRTLLSLFILMLLLVGYYFTFPQRLSGADWYRFFLLAAFGHLAVAVAPFFRKDTVSDFWHYNKTLFLGFLTAVLYSGVLFAGISIAIFATNELFNLHIPEETFFRLWIVMAGVMNTFIFLSGIPSVQEKKALEEYPKGLKIFTQFVLIPLVSLYVLILLVYELKIIIQGELPNGWVSNLIIAFAVSGILSLLLIFPVRKFKENKWIRWYGKLYYLALIPLTILLFVAIGIRIRTYGFTEERFLVLITGIWLAFMILYFIFSKNENIKVVPLSLMITILVTLCLITPVCRNSQQNRLRRILINNNILKNDHIAKAGHPLPVSVRRNLTSIIQYLYENHGVATVQPFFKTDLYGFSASVGTYSYGFADSVLSTVGIEAAPAYRPVTDKDGKTYFSVTTPNNFSVETMGYDYYLAGSYFGSSDERNTWKINNKSISAKMEQQDTLTLWTGNDQLIAIPTGHFLKQVIQEYAYLRTPPTADSGLVLTAENHKIKVKVILRNLNGYAAVDKMDYSSLNLQFDYLIRLK